MTDVCDAANNPHAIKLTCCNYSVPPQQWKSGLRPGCRPCSTCWCTPCCLSVCCPWPSFWPCGCTATANLRTATWTSVRWDGPYSTPTLIWVSSLLVSHVGCFVDASFPVLLLYSCDILQWGMSKFHMFKINLAEEWDMFSFSVI